MLFKKPIPFLEAIAMRRAKKLLPTTLGSKELSALAPAIRERAMFSARVTNTQFLSKADKLINGIVSPTSSTGPGARKSPLSRIEARAELQNYLDSIQYKAPKASGPEGPTPRRGKAGSLQDLSSNRRIDLIVDTNVKMAHGFGQHAIANDPDIIDAIPCQELYRLGNRKVPRDWVTRWTAAGGKIYGGRMIARKDSSVWTSISRFGSAYPPFDFNSGMWTREIFRREAEELGVITNRDVIKPDTRNFNDNVEATFPKGVSKGLATAVLDAFKDIAVLEAGKLILKGATV